jgi:hypothetical protein
VALGVVEVDDLDRAMELLVGDPPDLLSAHLATNLAEL